MKTIGIIGAMEEEITYLRSKIEIVNAKNIVGTDFYIGKMGAKNVVLVKSGIGKVNAAICTQVLIDLYGIDYVINTGIAGSMDKELHLGDVVVSTELVQHDFDTSVFDDELPGYIPRLDMRFFEADKNLINLAMDAGAQILEDNKIVAGRIASGDQFIASKEKKDWIAKTFKPLCVEMEGAAIAHASYLNRIPFVVIRAISDNSDGDMKTYESCKYKVAENYGKIVEKMVAQL